MVKLFRRENFLSAILAPHAPIKLKYSKGKYWTDSIEKHCTARPVGIALPCSCDTLIASCHCHSQMASVGWDAQMLALVG